MRLCRQVFIVVLLVMPNSFISSMRNLGPLCNASTIRARFVRVSGSAGWERGIFMRRAPVPCRPIDLPLRPRFLAVFLTGFSTDQGLAARDERVRADLQRYLSAPASEGSLAR